MLLRSSSPQMNLDWDLIIEPRSSMARTAPSVAEPVRARKPGKWPAMPPLLHLKRRYFSHKLRRWRKRITSASLLITAMAPPRLPEEFICARTPNFMMLETYEDYDIPWRIPNSLVSCPSQEWILRCST